MNSHGLSYAHKGLRNTLCNYLVDWVADNLDCNQYSKNKILCERRERLLHLVSEHLSLNKKDPFCTYQCHDNEDLMNQLVVGGYKEFQRHVKACLGVLEAHTDWGEIGELTPDVYVLKRRKPPYFITKLPAVRVAGRSRASYYMKDIGEAVYYANNFDGKDPEKAWVTDEKDDEIVPAPNGLHVFPSLFSDDEVLVRIESLRKLFRLVEKGPEEGEEAVIEKNDPRFQTREFLGPGRAPNNILFIANGGAQPPYRNCMRHILSYDRDLHDFIARYAEFYQVVMGITADEFATCQLQLVHYFPGKGLNAHIDSVSAFGNTLGPIFTINMNEQVKPFDLYPTFKQPGTPVLRIFTEKGQTTMMDGESRILWSHGIPYGSGSDNFTIAFKFPCLPPYRGDDSGGKFNVVVEDRSRGRPVLSRLTHDIPQNLVHEYRRPLHDHYQQQVVPAGLREYIPPP